MFYQKRAGKSSYFVFKELEAISGFIHVFTSRQIDTEINDAKDAEEGVSKNDLLLATLGLRTEQIVQLHQTHSDKIVVINEKFHGQSGKFPAGDGVILLSAGYFSVIRSADCLPILLVVAEQKKVCSLHAGWRGTRERIAAKGVSKFWELTGVHPQEMIGVLGPCIRSCCYEVGVKIRNQFEKKGHDVERIFTGRRLDLVEANLVQLKEMGVRHVLDSQACTFCQPESFYSCRREGKTGRMWALAGFRR